MDGVTGAGFAAFFCVSLVVGLRLIWLARRSGQLPELLIGIGVLGIGPVGFSLMLASQVLAETRPATSTLCIALGQLAVTAGAFSKYLFNWRVYRPASRLAGAAVALGALALIGSYAVFIVQGFPPGPPGLRSVPMIVALLWGSAEALGYWRRMRLRSQLGLGDALVQNRFLVWGLGAGAAGVGSLISTLVTLRVGPEAMLDPQLLRVLSLHGLLAAVCMWLAFLPPKVYTRFIGSRGPAGLASPVV